MFGGEKWRVFLAGMLSGTVLIAAVWAAAVWWKPRPTRSAEDDVVYDRCLMANAGNTVTCDAMMRLLDRERVAAAAMKQEAAKMLAAGFSKRDVVKWAEARGFVGSDLSDAVGISLSDLQKDNY